MPRTLHATLAVLYSATAEVHTPRATRGSIPGASSAEFQLAGDQVAGTCVNHYANTEFAGIGVFSGAIADRTGEISYAVTGNCAHDVVTADWRFLPATASGGLVGMNGSARYVARLKGGTGGITLVPDVDGV
ncbi:uncharacterized protein LOC62_05G006839 [Vanrija pseudolonga]|uniref:Uncharacterized protein n=1 Tax=Vanrija pseudolonga TaxID=143232 RepID=A0AAF0YEZ3_9TREE|nr:hypothetical protein LOC62_05G006839 [Vanrija pseudolonga]